MQANQVPTQAELDAAIGVLHAVAEAIRALGSIPSGHLYARLMGSNMSFETYTQVIATLVRAKLITNQNNVITWVAK